MQDSILLIIGYVWPEPKSSAAGSHMLGLIKMFLADGYHIVFASPADKSEHRFALESIGVEEQQILLNSSSFDEYAARLKPEVVLFDRFMMEEQFGWRIAKACPDALRILDTEDLHFLRHARHQAFKANKQVEESDLKQDSALREVASIYRSDLSLIISCVELDLLKNTFGVSERLLLECPLILEPSKAETTDNLPAYSQRTHFITIGNFRHAPNWDAVLFLKQQIWPLIKKQLPEAELHIYGAYPPPKATQLHNPKDSFLVKGWAASSSEVISDARVCLAPLRFGAGLKGKLVEAMLCGTPNVTTSVGAEGMHDNLAWSGFICNDAESFAEHAVKLYQDNNLWAQAQQAGFEIIEHKLDYQSTKQKLMERIKSLKSTLTAHRLANFTGAMLQHHQHKSTQYMSQWIEAKNKLRVDKP